MTKHTDTSRSGDLVERFNRFLNEWGKSRQYGDVIYGLHVGTDREVELTATSIRQAADRIKALEAENERLTRELQAKTALADDHFRNAKRLAERCAALGEKQ